LQGLTQKPAASAVAMGGSSSRKQSSEVKSGTPSPVKTLRKKIQGYAFNTEDIGGVTLSTAFKSKEDKPPLRKSKQNGFRSTIQLTRPSRASSNYCKH
jgi:hypothetical protein